MNAASTPSRSACWRAAAGSRSCSPRRPGAGLPVVCVGIRGEADPELAEPVATASTGPASAAWAGMIRCFKREGVRRVVMAGKVHKAKRHAHAAGGC